MSMVERLLEEFKHEMKTTRKVLDVVPEEHWQWTPHEKSMNMARLVSHIAEIPGLVERVMHHDEWSVKFAGPKYTAETKAAALETFDKNVKDASVISQGHSDEKMMQEWRITAGEKTLLKAPRLAAYRILIIKHLVHHRGQLTVYLRLNDAPVPAVYGNSADENPFG